jgi:hypothetical protein
MAQIALDGAGAFLKAPPQRRAQAPGCRLVDDSETHDADEDQIGRDNKVQQARHDENENAGDERNDGLQMRDADDHDDVPWWLGGNETARWADEFQNVIPGRLLKAGEPGIQSLIGSVVVLRWNPGSRLRRAPE